MIDHLLPPRMRFGCWVGFILLCVVIASSRFHELVHGTDETLDESHVLIIEGGRRATSP
jgi:hypothetical protein